MKKNHFLINCFQFWKQRKLLLPLKLTIFLCFLVFLNVFATNTILAQKQKITGTITDASTNEPLIGVNVIVEGTTIGSVSIVWPLY